MPKSLAEMQTEVYEWTQRKGWRPDPSRTFGDDIALLHSEASEALEAYRDYHHTNLVINDGKPDGVPAEFADILIRLLDSAATYGIDLEEEFERKMAYNEKRPFRHGGKAL